MICIKNYDMKRVKWENEQHLRVFPKTSPCGISGFLKKKRNLQSQNKKKTQRTLQQKNSGFSSPDGAVRGGLREVPHLGLSGPRENTSAGKFFCFGIKLDSTYFFHKKCLTLKTYF